jgi:ribonuclease HI
MINNVVIFTDGSCIKRKGEENKCGYGVHFPNKEFIDISEKFTYGELTNQRTELYAIYKGLKKVTRNCKFNFINVYTDSMYSINSVTKWINAWKKNDWKNAQKKDVANQDIIKKIDKILEDNPKKIFFHHVNSHTGKQDFYSKCNEIADTLATNGALK